jgi:hypothetical protein
MHERVEDLRHLSADWSPLLALRDKDKAAELSRVVRDTDPIGKYRNRAQKQLESLEYTNTGGVCIRLRVLLTSVGVEW